MGGHHLTTSPGGGLNTGPSPTGALAAEVPLDLPGARGDVPIPVRVLYTGSSRAGAAGAGWDVQLSSVRRSRSLSRRKPGDTVDPTAVAQRITMDLLGKRMLMVRDGAGRYTAHAASEYIELEPVGSHWVARDLAGREYEFHHLGGLGDPDVWYLTDIRAPGGTDRVELTYSVFYKGCYKGRPQVLLDQVAYTFADDDTTPLFLLDLKYQQQYIATTADRGTRLVCDTVDPDAKVAILDLSSTEGSYRSRTDYLGAVRVWARDNHDRGSAARVIRAYSFSYEDDPDTGLPRLAAVDVTGDSGAGPMAGGLVANAPANVDASATGGASLPVARYRYGSVVSQGGITYANRPDVPLPVSILSLSDTTVTTSLFGEVTWTSRMIRDMTGDGLPDLLVKNDPGSSADAHWTMYPNISDAGGIAFASSGLGIEIPAPVDYETMDRIDGDDTTVHETWTRLVDWNGDGRLDVVSAFEGPDRDQWRAYLNFSDGTDYGINWVARDIDIDVQRAWLQERGFDLAATAANKAWGLLFGGVRVPLARKKSADDYWGERTRCRRWEGSYYLGEWGEPFDCDDQPEPSTDDSDTVVEWALHDLNGDGFLDLLTSDSVLLQKRDTWPHPGELCGEHHYCDWNTLCEFVDRELYDCVCSCTYVEGLSYGATESRVYAFINRAGNAQLASVPSTFADQPRLVQTSSKGLSGVQWWEQLPDGDAVMRSGFLGGAPDGLLARRGSSSNALGDGRGNGEGAFLALGGPSPAGPSYDSRRNDVCEFDSTPEDYSVHQLVGTVDLTGDGLPDRIGRHPDSSQWYVGIATTAGLTPNVPLYASNFALSDAEGRCSESAESVAGLIDLDGDGRPELVRASGSKLRVASLVGSDGMGAFASGRLTAIDNGRGGVTRYTYASAKLDSRTEHQLPFPEIVVSSIERVVENGNGTGVQKTRYAYGDASLVYDPIWHKWRFPGYRLRAALQGLDYGTVYGIAEVTERTANYAPGGGFDAYVQMGRPWRTNVYEGSFAIDPYELLDLTEADFRHRGQRTVAYGIARLPDSGQPGVECRELNPRTGGYIGEDLCRRPAVVYRRGHDWWRGIDAPGTGTRYVAGSRHIMEVDALGRALRVHDFGDTYPGRTDDDRCYVYTYAEPAGPDVPVMTRVHTSRVTDCGYGGQTPRALAGVRFEYDGLSETGDATAYRDGRPTRRITEVWDPTTGDLVDAYEAAELSYAPSPPHRLETIVRRRNADDPAGAVHTTSVSYDAFGLTPTLAVQVANDVAVPLERATHASVRPSAPDTTTDSTGMQHVEHHDAFGRPTLRSIVADGVEYAVEELAYVDDPADPHAVVRRYATLTPAASRATATAVIETRVHYDALGRARYAQTDLGDSYPGATIVSGWTQYDPLGRPKFVADAFQYTSDPFDADAASLEQYGTSYTYYPDGRRKTASRGSGYSSSSITYRTSERYTAYSWYGYQGGYELARAYSPDERDSHGSNYLTRTESLVDARGLVRERRRIDHSNQRIDFSTFDYDRLGRRTEFVRFANPQAKSGPVATAWEYDSLGRMVEVREHGISPVRNEFDHWDALVESQWTDTDGALRRDVRHYDGLSRPTHRQLIRVFGPTSQSELDAYYHYDLVADDGPQSADANVLGRLSWASTAGGQKTYLEYDALGRQHQRTDVAKTEAGTATYRTTTTRDMAGNLRSVRFELPGISEQYDYDYDSAGRLVRIDPEGDGPSAPMFEALEIDVFGRHLDVALGNAVREQWAYETGHRRLLDDHSVVTADDHKYLWHVATYDALGRVEDLRESDWQLPGVTVGGPRNLYSYDDLGRLESFKRTESGAIILGTEPEYAFDKTYAYDALGNLTSVTEAEALYSNRSYSYAAGVPDALTTVNVAFGTSTFEYDGAGNVSEQRNLSWFGGVQPHYVYSYDSASRLTGWEDQYDSRARIDYGPMDDIAAIEVHSWGTLVESERRFGPLLRELFIQDEGTVALERTIPGADGVPLAVVRTTDAGTETVYRHTDGRGNRLFTDAAGLVVQRVDYDPYGRRRSDSGDQGALAYSNEQWNDGYSFRGTPNRVMLGARLYDASIGRFLQRDRVAHMFGSSRGNPYAFAFNDPVSFIDPTGLSSQCDDLAGYCPGEGTGFDDGTQLPPGEEPPSGIDEVDLGDQVRDPGALCPGGLCELPAPLPSCDVTYDGSPCDPGDIRNDVGRINQLARDYERGKRAAERLGELETFPDRFDDARSDAADAIFPLPPRARDIIEHGNFNELEKVLIDLVIDGEAAERLEKLRLEGYLDYRDRWRNETNRVISEVNGTAIQGPLLGAMGRAPAIIYEIYEFVGNAQNAAACGSGDGDACIQLGLDQLPTPGE